MEDREGILINIVILGLSPQFPESGTNVDMVVFI